MNNGLLIMSRSKAIEKKCKDCIYDDIAPGTWRQQITICPMCDCPLYEYRPKTDRPIPESVLEFYGIKKGTFEYRCFNSGNYKSSNEKSLKSPEKRPTTGSELNMEG